MGLEIVRSSENSVKVTIPIDDYSKIEKIKKTIHAALDKAIILQLTFRVKTFNREISLYFEGTVKDIKAIEKWLKKNLWCFIKVLNFPKEGALIMHPLVFYL